ncbi:hypothetical protein ACFW04_012960 [Cataglyphis niger]
MPPRRSSNTISPSFASLEGTGRKTPERTPPRDDIPGGVCHQEQSNSGLLKQRIQAYFEGLYSGGELLDTPDVEAEHTQPPAEGEGFEYLLDPFTEIESGSEGIPAGDEGYYEHNFVLQEILTEARRITRQAVVALLDLSNAFGSVPHAVIRRALVCSGVPGGIVNVWQSMYDGCTTRVRAADGLTAPIPVRSGVQQDCPLSPIVFDLAIDLVLRAVTDVNAGYDLLGSRVSILAYADDIALIADTPEGMQRLLAAA